MAGSLHGKVAVVTGASRGLGRAIARALAAEDCSVALLARPSADLDNVASELGERALKVACDVGDPSALARAFASIVSKHRGIDILINNAAITELHKIETASTESVQREIAVNLVGPILCCREAIPYLRASGGGDIVNVSSEAVREPFPFLTVYAATKGGLETFSAGLRNELRAERIRVTVLRCGHIGDSKISSHWPPEERAAFDAEMRRGGHDSFTGGVVTPGSIAQALVDVLRLPHELNADLIELRSNLPAMS